MISPPDSPRTVPVLALKVSHSAKPLSLRQIRVIGYLTFCPKSHVKRGKTVLKRKRLRREAKSSPGEALSPGNLQ